MIRNIFFDLDGTLLGMDVRAFTYAYYESLAEKLAALGYDGKTIAKAVMGGFYTMRNHDGSLTNAQAFWEKFSAQTGLAEADFTEVMRDYYTHEFGKVRVSTQVFAESAEIVRVLKEKGYRLFLTTNAVFPIEAIESRLGWAGLTADSFEHITLYDNASFCKPNSRYFREVIERFELDAAETVMIGNDREEDYAAEECGVRCILTQENLLNEKELPMDGVTVYTHAQLLDWARELPNVKE